MIYDVIRLVDRPDLIETAAEWFHNKWGTHWKHIWRVWRNA